MEPRPVIRVAAGVIVDDERILVCRRRSGIAAQGKWEFPGGKIERDETADEALLREIKEELAIEIRVVRPITLDTTTVNDQGIELHCMLATLVGERPLTSTDHDELRWIGREDLANLDWASPDLPCVATLQSEWPGA